MSSDTKVSFVYFDLGNVLLFFDHDIACENLAQLTGKPFAKIKEFLLAPELVAKVDTGAISETEFYELVCETFHVANNQADVLLAVSDIFTLNTPMLALVASVHDAGIRTGILSNTCHPHWEFAYQKYRVLRSSFDVLALSYELKAAKPDPKIYEAAAELAGVPAEEIFFVDDRSENIAAAQQAGYLAKEFVSVWQLAKELRDVGLRFNY